MFGKKNVPERFARYVAKRVSPGQRYRVIVGHCDAAADGELLLSRLKSLIDCQDAWLAETGPAVGAHAGPGALVISLQPVFAP